MSASAPPPAPPPRQALLAGPLSLRSVRGQWYSPSTISCSISVVLDPGSRPAWKAKPEAVDQSLAQTYSLRKNTKQGTIGTMELFQTSPKSGRYKEN